MACLPGIATMSLGRAAMHPLEHKLDQAQLHGFKGIELFFDDLEEYARSNLETLEYDQDFNDDSYMPAANAHFSAFNGHANGTFTAVNGHSNGVNGFSNGIGYSNRVNGHSHTNGTSHPVNDHSNDANGYSPPVNGHSYTNDTSSGVNGHSNGVVNGHYHTNGISHAVNDDRIEMPEDLIPPFAGSLNLTLPAATAIAAARSIKRLCDARSLTIISLQPFRHYEGLLSRAEHARRIAELRVWIACATALQTSMIGIPSTFLPAAQLHGDLAAHVADLAEAADLAAAASPPVRLVYESLAWGTLVDSWEASWAVCRAVDRANFGIVLDAFNIAARAYADPAQPSGVLFDSPHAAQVNLAKSLARLTSTADTVAPLDLAKVFYIQVADGERLAAPLVPGHPFHAPDQPPRMSWSRNCRLFYDDHDHDHDDGSSSSSAKPRLGAPYLPIRAVLAAILAPAPAGLGFRGWISMEVFSRSLADPAPGCAAAHAARGARAWRGVLRDFAHVGAA